MGLREQLNEDLKAAMKAKDANRLGTIRLLKDAIGKFEISRPKDAQPLTEAELLGVVEKQVKQRREAIELYQKGNRQDLVAKEQSELAILEAYMPKQLAREEIQAEVQAIIATLGTKEFSKVMREASTKLKGRADGKTVSEIVKALTS